MKVQKTVSIIMLSLSLAGCYSLSSGQGIGSITDGFSEVFSGLTNKNKQPDYCKGIPDSYFNGIIKADDFIDAKKREQILMCADKGHKVEEKRTYKLRGWATGLGWGGVAYAGDDVDVYQCTGMDCEYAPSLKYASSEDVVQIASDNKEIEFPLIIKPTKENESRMKIIKKASKEQKCDVEVTAYCGVLSYTNGSGGGYSPMARDCDIMNLRCYK